VFILLATQAFLEVIILSLGRRIPMISSSSHKETVLSSKRKSMVKEREMTKHTRQMPIPKTMS